MTWRCFLGVFGAFALAEDPCASREWREVRELLWDAVGDGREALQRLQTLRDAPPPPPLQPSACLHGAVSLHLLHLLREPREARLREIKASGEEIVTVLLESSFLKVAAARWPIFGLLHLAQAQLESEEAPSAEAWEDIPPDTTSRWQPLVSDDHVRFRNWVQGHLAHGQTPPLVDSVHFLARADPREPGQGSRACSAAKAMGYLASALVLSQEKDPRIREEAAELVTSAEAHVKHCDESLQLLLMLRTEWPIWWLTHMVFQNLHPPELPPAPPAPPGPPGPPGSTVPEKCWELHEGPKLCPMTQAAFIEVNGMYLLDEKHLKARGLQSSQILQLFRDGRPLQRLSECCQGSEPSWSSIRWPKPLVSVQDPKIDPSAYSVSFGTSQVGLYVEESSAGDPYNAEWLQAYLNAFERMALQPHIISKSEDAKAGVLYFWRINQMFGGGRLAGSPGVGVAVAQHLAAFEQRGAVLWPRPETMQFYQDKIALRELFTRIGVPAPSSWVVTSLTDLEDLLQRGDLKEADFPLVLKHPYAASSRGMRSCGSLAEMRTLLSQWLQEFQAPCLLQRRVTISRDMRVTYVGGEIIQGYWRVKVAEKDLSSGSAGGSSLDFDTPLQELAPFVRRFAAATGIDIGGMDVAFPQGEGPVVFEVSPIFDLNPEPPAEWRGRPYREYKQTEDYKKRRGENYALCARKVVEYALHRRGHLFVDIDNTISDAWKRIQRATIPAWPGQSFDAKAHSPEELAKDLPLPGAQAALASLSREWEITYLSARGAVGAFQATSAWLRAYGFPNDGRLVLVSAATEKIAWLQDAKMSGRPVLLVDDLTRGHHLAAPLADEEMRQALEIRGLRFEVFDPFSSSWAQLAQRLLEEAYSRPFRPCV